ncbi:Ig-like domain repeat protein, partial [Actinospica durhamensis]
GGGGGGSSYSRAFATYTASPLPGNGQVIVTYGTRTSSSTTLASSHNPSDAGQPVTYFAMVTGVSGLAAPTGTVTFADGGTPIGTANVLPNGLAHLTHVFTSGGSHSITAAYSGNNVYQGSISAPLIQTVRQRVSVTTTSLPDGTRRVRYTAQLHATGGTGVYEWRIAAGSLPAGLTLSPTGAITGTPRTVGASDFTVAVRDTAVPPETATAPLTLAVIR